jgi:hypothetical protein
MRNHGLGARVGLETDIRNSWWRYINQRPEIKRLQYESTHFPAQLPSHCGAVSLEREKFSMSRNGPHTSTKKLSWWKSSIKIFSDLHDSKREEKLLSSSDFVTAASMVQQFANLNGSTSARE